MFSLKKAPVCLSDTFFTDLVSKLHHPDKNTIRKAALEAISLLATVNRDTLPQGRFKLDELKAIDSIEGLDDSTKRKLCKEITKVFVGRCWSGSVRILFDQAVDAHYDSSPWTYFFGRRPTILPITNLNERLNLIYEILSRAGDVSAAHIEEISADSKLLCAVHAVVKGLPPGNDLGKVIEICHIAVPELFVDLMSILQNRNIEAVASAVSLFRGKSITARSYSYVLKALRDVPKEELHDVISYATQLIKSDEYATDRIKMIKAIADIPKEDRADVINKTTPLRGLPNVIRAVGLIPADDREEVVNFVGQIINPSDGEKALVTFIRLIRAIPKEEREDVIARAKLLSRDKDSADERAYIIFTLLAIVIEKRKEVIDAAAPLIREGDNGFDRMKIIEAIAEAPSEDRMYVAGKATLFINKDGARVVKTIIDIPQEEREDAIDKALLLIKDESYGVPILEMFGGLSREDRANALSHVLPLIKDFDSTYDRKMILETVIAIPEAIRAEVVREVEKSDDAYQLCSEMSRIAALKSLPPEEAPDILAMVGPISSAMNLEAIRKIPKKDRAEILRLAMPFFKGDEPINQRMEMYEAIAGILEANRANTISIAARLTRDGDAVYDFLNIQKAIRRIPTYDLEDVIDKTLLCIEEDSTSRNEILQAMAGIPAKDREDLLSKVLPLLTEKRDSFNIAIMLKAMGALSPLGRADVMSVALSTIKEGDSLQCQMLLLSILAGLVDGERTDVINLAASFNKEGDRTWGIAILAEEIGCIPKEERSNVVATAKLLVTEEEDYDRRVEILKAVKLIPGEERANAILLTKALMKEGDSCCAFLWALSGIPLTERSEAIEKAAPLMGAIEGYYRAQMLRAVGGIPNGERADVVEKAMMLVQEGADLKNSAYLVEAIGGIPKEDRPDVIEKAHLFFKLVFTSDTTYIPSSWNWTKAIKKIGHIPKEERMDVLNKAAFLVIHDDIESCYCILDAIGGLPKEERADFAVNATLFMAGIRSRAGKMVFLGLMSRISNYSQQFVKECLIISNSERITLSTHEAFRLVLPNDFLEVVTAVANDPNTIHGVFWKNYSLMSSLIRNHDLEHISVIFDNLEGAESALLAHWILHSADNQLIEQNHPLVQKAIAVACPEETNNDTN